MRVLVAGATGGCGRLTVRRLGQLGIEYRALTRDARKAEGLGATEVVEGNAFSIEDCRRAVMGCDAVICTLGERRTPRDRPIVDGEGVINLAAAAKEAGANRFILVSAMCVEGTWTPLLARWVRSLPPIEPVMSEKARSQAFLRESGLRWTTLHPGFLASLPMRGEPLVLPPDAHAPGFTTRQAIADVAVRALLSENAVDRALVVVNRSLRWAVWRGKPIRLDVPWSPWQAGKADHRGV